MTATKVLPAGGLLATFVLPLPPSLNHAYLRGQTWGGRRNVRASDELRAWQDEAALIVRGWEPPKHRPLAVWMQFHLPANRLNVLDLDGLEKFVIDAVVGKRRDNWVRRKVSEKTATAGPGWQAEGGVIVTVSEME